MTMTECRVAIYARVSTEEQAEHGYSIDAQLDTLKQYCRQTGKILVGEYVDRGISGKEMTKRYELKRLLRDADSRMFDEVIVWKINRMSRKTKDLLEIVERLNKQNIYFRSFSENFETETPMGRFALQMMGAVGELERNTIVENVKLGLKQRARMGYWNGGTALGYRSVDTGPTNRQGRATRLEIVPEEAIIVQKIFESYASGKGLKSIANKINHEGYRTKKGNTFSTSAVKEILMNPIYTGYVRYNRFEGWSEKRRKGKNPNPIIEKGHHQPIISQDLWDRVQVLREQKSKTSPRTYDGVALLTGLIFCPKCGSPMITSRTVNYSKNGEKIVRRYYSCSKFKYHGSTVCQANSVRAEYAEEYVLARIKEMVKNPKILKDILDKINQRRISNSGPMEQELTEIEKKLNQLAQKKKKLIDVFQLDAIDAETLTARMDELKLEETSLYNHKAQLTFELGEDGRKPVPYQVVYAIMERIDELLHKAPPDKCKTLLHMVIKRISIGANKQISKIEMRLDQQVQQSLSAEDPSGKKNSEGFSILAPLTLSF